MIGPEQLGREIRRMDASARAAVLLELNALGQRMASKEQTDFETLQGLDISHGSLTELKAIYLQVTTPPTSRRFPNS